MSGWLAESGVAAKWEACKAASTADAVDAPTYAEASVTLITVFDVIGTAMSIPKNDMMGNATAVQKFAAENPGKTLQELCDAEIAEAGGDAEKAIKKEGCTVKLLWLSRAMKFIQVLLQTLDAERSATLSACVTKGYEASLKQYHGMAVKLVFKGAVNACPYRDKFMKGLAATEEEALAKIAELMPTVNEVLAINVKYLEGKGLKI
eukprot:Transcript_28635.p4 GENE.Transcript_28635~~Transcript_28635.p4  ORF type:complete len:206 (-),score=102.79 Transcript_28635:1003-1620(-)